MQQRFDNHTFNNTPFSVPININNSPSTCTITDDINVLPIESMFSTTSAGRSSLLLLQDQDLRNQIPKYTSNNKINYTVHIYRQ